MNPIVFSTSLFVGYGMLLIASQLSSSHLYAVGLSYNFIIDKHNLSTTCILYNSYFVGVAKLIIFHEYAILK